MRPGLRQLVWIGTLGVACTLSAWGQVTVGDNLSLNLDADASFGYNGSFGDRIPGAHNLNFGGAGNLKGYYYNPNFFSFYAAPYYGQSRLNSNYRSVFDSSGVSAAVRLFSGGHTPGSFSYSKTYNREGEFGLPNAGTYRTHGQGQSFGVGWAFSFPDYPSLEVGYNFGDGTSEVLGTGTSGKNDFRTFTVGSGYQFHGFVMNASYLNNRISQKLPEITDFSELLTANTGQNTTQFNLSHRLPFNGNFQTNLNRTNYSSDFAGVPIEETFDSVTTSATMNPISRLSLGMNVGYTDNLAASLLESVLPTAPGAVRETAHHSSSSLDISEVATYAITQQFRLQGWADQRRQDIFGYQVTSDLYSGGANYSRAMWSGMVGLYAGVSRYTSSVAGDDQTGTTESISYSRRLGAWSASSSFHYSRNVQSALASYTQSGCGYGVSLNRMLGSWRWNLTASGSQNALDSVADSSTFAHNYSSSIASRRVSFSGSYARSSGNAIQTGTGLVTTPGPLPIVPPSLLILYGGNTYSLAASVHPTGRLNISGDYLRTNYHTQNAFIVSENRVKQSDFIADYYFRQMHFVVGYSYLYQGIGAGAGVPATYQAVFAGVTRHFNFF